MIFSDVLQEKVLIREYWEVSLKRDECGSLAVQGDISSQAIEELSPSIAAGTAFSKNCVPTWLGF